MDGLIKYNQEVLIPVLENRFKGVDKRLGGVEVKLNSVEGRLGGVEIRLSGVEKKVDSVEKELREFKNEALTSFDKIFGKLDILIENKDIGNYQDEQKRKFFGIVVNHLETGKTTPEQLEEISKLDVL